MRRSDLLRILAITALLAGAAGYVHSVRAQTTIPGLRAGGVPLGAIPFRSLGRSIDDASNRFLDRSILLLVGEERIRVRRRDAGFVVDRAALDKSVREAGKSGDPFVDVALRLQARRGRLDVPIPAHLDLERAIEFLSEMKSLVDRAPVDAKLDLDHHTIAAERPGRLLEVYESLTPLAAAAAAPVELLVRRAPARITREDLGPIDISVVLGRWETHYSSIGPDSDRTYNLKVGADHLNGHVLQPHALFSFNEVVGPRTEKEGYRVAPVIQAGELVDGLAGGMCQIASTLHAAALFAGLEIVSSTPHSRPSAYIPMGLDATVVYPTTDLKLRNPFDFPIVMHYQVNQGSVKVELLGKARPYKVVFERQILEEHGFGSETRGDPQAPRGQRFPLQEGYPGYRAIRRRYLFDAKTVLPRFWSPPTEPLEGALARRHIEPIAVEKSVVAYPSTTLILAIGTGPPSLKKRPPPPSHHIPVVPAQDKPFGRILQ